MVLGLGIPDDAGCRIQIPVYGEHDAGVLESKGKLFGAPFSVERSIKLTTAGNPRYCFSISSAFSISVAS